MTTGSDYKKILSDLLQLKIGLQDKEKARDDLREQIGKDRKRLYALSVECTQLNQKWRRLV